MKELYRKPFYFLCGMVIGILGTIHANAQPLSMPFTAEETARDIPQVTLPLHDFIHVNQVAPASCFGKADGIAEVSIPEFIEVRQIEWSGKEVGKTRRIEGLNPGIHYVRVTDLQGNTYEDSLIIESRFSIEAEAFVVSDVSSEDAQDGIAAVKILGGGESFSYYWDGLPEGQGAIVKGLGTGMYTVTIQNEMGCETTEAVSIIYATPEHPANGEGLSGLLRERSTNIYPNPSSGVFFLYPNRVNQNPESMQVFDQRGRIVFKKSSDWEKEVDLSSMPAGIYSVVFHYNDRQITEKLLLN